MSPIAVLLYVGLCVLIGYIGRDKKFGFVGNFLVSLLLSPIIGIIVWLVQPDAAKPAEKAS